MVEPQYFHACGVQKRISLGFKDINMSFKKNPLTNDFIVIKNDNAIARL